MYLHPTVLDFLAALPIDGQVVHIPREAPDHLIRAIHPIFRLYGGVPKGKRTTDDARYVFGSDPEPIIALILETRMANLLNFWPSPVWLAVHMVDILAVETLPEHALVVEPSCGTGKLIDPLLLALAMLGRGDVSVLGIEFSTVFAQRLQERYKRERPDPMPAIIQRDFLLWEAPRPVHRFLANPPYSAVRPTYQPFVYAAHLLRMIEMLADGGMMVGLVPDTWRSRDIEKWPDLGRLRAAVEESGAYQALPPGTFLEQGSGVSCDLIAVGRGFRPVLPPLPDGRKEDTGPEPGYERVTLFVGNLPQYLGDNALLNLFSAHGNVRATRCPSNRTTGRLRGFGFVEIDCADVDRVIAATNGQVLSGSAIEVRRAYESTASSALER